MFSLLECVLCMRTSVQTEGGAGEGGGGGGGGGLCRNAGLVCSFVLFELNPQTKTLHYSRISTSLPTTLHLASPSTMIQLNP